MESLELRYIWTKHPIYIWVLSEIIEIDFSTDKVVVKCDEGDGEKTVDSTQTHSFDQTHIIDVDDLCLMNKFHEAPLLHNLRTRYEQTKIYTNIGDVLVSINPYQLLQGLYDNPLSYLRFQHNGFRTEATTPHIYNVANYAFTDMLQANLSKSCSNPHQSIVVTGESGSGKTESTKYIIKFLVDIDDYLGVKHLNAHQLMESSNGENVMTDLVQQQQLSESDVSLDQADGVSLKSNDGINNVLRESHYIFESFGNAKTIRNDNSSRFGKFTKLIYGQDGRLLTAEAETFLLEKSRLYSINNGERGYHIFYHMLVADEDIFDKKALGLDGDVGFKLLGSAVPDTLADRDRMTHLHRALVSTECSPTDIAALWKLVSAIMHLSNVTPLYSDNDNAVPTLVSPTWSLEDVSAVIGVSAQSLTEGLTAVTIKAKKRSSVHRKILGSEDVLRNLFALLKHLYSCLFKWLVRKINESFSKKARAPSEFGVPTIKSSHIGILDIFGFEIFPENSFEQLCINYANEQLQNLFNASVFAKEQEQYMQEGIMWEEISWKDNSDVIGLISKKPDGLLSLLDAQGLLNRANPDDNAVLSAFLKHHPNTTLVERARFGNDSFTIRHFAGPVQYCIKGFIAKNDDSLQKDLWSMLHTSCSAFIQDILSTSVQDHDDSNEKLAATVTVSSQFCEQLEALLSTLSTTKMHYVKCITPNSHKSSRLFDSSFCMDQFRCSGILELVRIKREGYPNRLDFETFFQTYAVILKNHKAGAAVMSEANVANARQLASEIANLAMPTRMFQIGYNFIFLRDAYEVYMKTAVLDLLNKKSSQIGSVLRGYVERKRYHVMVKSAIRLQSVSRMVIERGRLKRKLRMIRLIQSLIRRHLSKAQFYRSVNAILSIQSTWRMHKCIRLRANMVSKITVLNAILSIQSTWRMHKCIRLRANMVSKITVLQSLWRSRSAFLILCKLRSSKAARVASSVISIQKIIRRKIAQRRVRRIRLRAPYQQRRDTISRLIATLKIQVFVKDALRRKYPTKSLRSGVNQNVFRTPLIASICRTFVEKIKFKMLQRK